MPRHILFQILAITLAVLVPLSCDDDDDDDLVHTSIGGDKVLSDLTDEEAVELCEDMAASRQAAASRESVCALGSAITGLVSEELCQNLYDACVSIDVDVSEINCNLLAGDVPSYSLCGLTVSEYSQCLEIRLQQARELADGFSCSSIEISIPETPEPCILLAEECPALTPVI